jgi:hypothetical protein
MTMGSSVALENRQWLLLLLVVVRADFAYVEPIVERIEYDWFVVLPKQGGDKSSFDGNRCKKCSGRRLEIMGVGRQSSKGNDNGPFNVTSCAAELLEFSSVSTTPSFSSKFAPAVLWGGNVSLEAADSSTDGAVAAAAALMPSNFITLMVVCTAVLDMQSSE